MLVVSGLQCNPCETLLDFEKATINDCTNQFKDTNLDGCKFHSKQGWERIMKEFKILQDQIDMAIASNCLDTLTIIDLVETRKTGMPYIKKALEPAMINRKDKAKWNKF